MKLPSLAPRTSISILLQLYPAVYLSTHPGRSRLTGQKSLSYLGGRTVRPFGPLHNLKFQLLSPSPAFRG